MTLPAVTLDQMDAISEAQEKGIVRAGSVSCLTLLEALSAAAKSSWVQVVLARINHVVA